MSKSRDGLSTKIHIAVEALGSPVRFLLTPGQASEYGQTNQLIEGMEADFVVAENGYDSDSFVASIRANGASPVIPPRKNRASPRDYDKLLYKERNPVERVFHKLKHYHLATTRYDRVVTYYSAMLSLASTVIWLT